MMSNSPGGAACGGRRHRRSLLPVAAADRRALPGARVRAATIDAVVAYLRTRPNADILWTSCEAGKGSPQPFYLRYGFVLSGDVKWGEDLLRLDLADAASQD